LVGFSLVLASRNGIDRKAYLRRLILVAGAAVLVTLGTWFALPHAYIFFGILHHIALASVLALPVLRLPVLAVAGGAITCFALPELVA
ncbi:heparan-alpha-glucosaminide N-acetyltransferase domain-containing protein, partial [Acinetobacter baumannii]